MTTVSNAKVLLYLNAIEVEGSMKSVLHSHTVSDHSRTKFPSPSLIFACS